MPSYDRTPGRYTFLRAARRMGFKPGLWLCCDYDLSFEEERRAAARDAAGGDPRGGGQAERGFEQDEHLGHARRMDDLTKPQTPWYEHLRDFVSQGAEWFKQDGANQVLDHPDRLYGNGMHDDEMHNLYPLLYSRQMYEGFAEHTGRRPMCFTPAGWTGLQRWTGTWTGDTGGEERPLAACLNLTMSGHGMVTVDMEVTTPEGIHFGFLLPWAQLNSWNYFRHPWFQGKELQGIFTAYARLRYALLPYLYAAAWEAHRTGPANDEGDASGLPRGRRDPRPAQAVPSRPVVAGSGLHEPGLPARRRVVRLLDGRSPRGSGLGRAEYPAGPGRPAPGQGRRRHPPGGRTSTTSASSPRTTTSSRYSPGPTASSPSTRTTA